MDNQQQRQLLVNSITLLYREHIAKVRSENSAETVKKGLEQIQLPEVSLGMVQERDIIAGLRDTALWMSGNPIDHTYDSLSLLQRLKLNCASDERLYAVFEQGIVPTLTDEENTLTVVSLRRSLQDQVVRAEAIKVITDASRQILFEPAKIGNFKQFLQKVTTSLEPYTIETNHADPAIISSATTSHEDSVDKIFSEAQDAASGKSLLRSGWQELNTMLQGGMMRGQAAVIGALQHNYKTGFSLSLFKGHCMYNKADDLLIDKEKKPLMLRISFEDDLALNMSYLFNNLYYNEHRQLPDMTKIDRRFMGRFLIDKLQSTGFHVRFLRVDPIQWTYKDIQNYVLKCESEGYEVIEVMLDYMYMVPTTGCRQGAHGEDVRDMWRRLRAFAGRHNFLLTSPHQLSTEAKMLVREGSSDFLEQIANKGYYAGCKQIDQEVDIELSLHIFKWNKLSFLGVQRGKHRVPGIIPDELKRFYLQFPAGAPIPDDIGAQNSAYRRLGGGLIGSGEETPFHELEMMEV